MRIIALLLALLGSLSLPAQTVGSPFTGDLQVAGQGGGAVSVTALDLYDGGTLPVDITSLNNVGLPFTLCLGAPAAPIPFGANSDGFFQSFDILLGAAVLDGLQVAGPNVAWPLFTIPSSGTFSVTFGFLPPAGFDTLQVAIASPSAALGLDFTQALLLDPVSPFLGPDTSAPGGTPLALGEDDTLPVTLVGGTFTFYGIVYSEVWVNANGSVSFGAGSTGFSATEAEFLADVPRVAPAWNDFSPQLQGEVRFLETADGIEICWDNVPVNGCTNDSNNFGLLLFWNGLGFDGGMFCDYGPMLGCGGSEYDRWITGVTPGGNLSGFNNVDLSIAGGVTAFGPLDALYEDFSLGFFGPFDLGASPAGAPVANDIFPDPATGAYTWISY